jgi:hypothetical protein
VQDCDQADWSAVEGDEPEGEDLEDGKVEEAGAFIVDCGREWLVGLLGGRGLGRRWTGIPHDSTSSSIFGLRTLSSRTD